MPFRATVFKTAALPLCDLSANSGGIENIPQTGDGNKRRHLFHCAFRIPKALKSRFKKGRNATVMERVFEFNNSTN
jgi:hypothetical protein